MDDTSPAIRDLLRKRYAAMTGNERLLLGFKSCETAKQIVLSSFPKGLSKKEIRIRLFLRYYSNDFSDLDKQKIIKHFESLD
jgi:hypothetical protein